MRTWTETPSYIETCSHSYAHMTPCIARQTADLTGTPNPTHEQSALEPACCSAVYGRLACNGNEQADMRDKIYVYCTYITALHI